MVSCQALVSPAGDAGTIEEGTDRAQSNEGACCDAERRSPKRDRQYQHIKDGLLDRGEGEDEAEEIAARTVNKERARAGEAKETSRLSVEDISSARRGGLRSHRGSGGRTRDRLYEEARRKNVPADRR
jgi:hypothetical protein